MPPAAAVLTATYTISLLAPAAGHRFAMTGAVVRAGRTLVVCRGEAFSDGAELPFAVMQATLTAKRVAPSHRRWHATSRTSPRLPPGGMRSVNNLDVLIAPIGGLS